MIRFTTRLVIAALFCAAALTSFTPTTAHAGEKWELISTADGVKVYRKEVKGSNMFAFKGVMTANVHFARVARVFSTSKLRRTWVDRWAADKDLKVHNSKERTYYIRFGLPWPVSDRDYVLNTKATLDVKRRIMTARIRSVNFPGYGPKSCCVRGKVVGTFYKFEALPGAEKTRLTVEVQTDPRGLLPAWLVNLIQKKWPYKTLTGLVRAAKKPNIQNHPDYVDWHTPYKEPAPVAPTVPAEAPKADKPATP
tara:strand:- start:147 stop:902 length:756 start_codon:yes stop_codon:yes gene_type:complete